MSGKAEKKVLNVLIIDDDEDDFFITSEYFKNIQNGYTFNIDWCPVYKDALNHICDRKYDVYFVDFYLGAKTGLDLIKEAVHNSCEEPIILLTGRGNHEIDILAMQAGAVDYLVKSDINAEKLERCIRYALGRYEFIKALKSNEQKFRSIFEKSKDCVFIANENFFFTDVNEAGCTLFEYTKEQLLQMSLFDLLANSADRNAIEQELQLRSGISDKEIDLLSSNRNRINSILSLSAEKDAKGSYYIQGIIHDITSLKKSEKATLQTEKLKATERLIRTLAHEVRNPLNNINLSVEQLDFEITGDEPRTYIDIINRNSKRIGDLITELLDSSRPSEIVLEEVSLQLLIEESIAVAEDRITLKKITLQVQYDNPGATIMADPSKLKIAFVNVIINAVEAMEESKGILDIRIKSETGKYVVSITDNGAGISEENLTKIFEPYYTSKRNGMGLGLASTLNIIQSHQAFVEVRSTTGTGTSFLISFTKIG